MKLSGSLERAQAIAPGQHAKARDLHYDLENELEHGLYDEDEADEGERAIAHLEANHPGVREASRSVTRPPALSRGAKRNLEESSSEPEPEDEDEAVPSSSGEPRRSRSVSRGAGRRYRGGSSGRRTLSRATGDAGEDFSGTVIKGLQFLLAAGIAYQLLQPKGSGAFKSVLGSIGSGVEKFVAPVDPFASSSSAAASGFNQVQQDIAAAAAANPNVFDTPTGTAPYVPPTFGNPPGGVFDTPGGVAPFKPPTGVPTVKAATNVKQPTSPLSLTIRVPALF